MRAFNFRCVLSTPFVVVILMLFIAGFSGRPRSPEPVHDTSVLYNAFELGYFLGKANLFAQKKKTTERRESLKKAFDAGHGLAACNIPVDVAVITTSLKATQISGFFDNTHDLFEHRYPVLFQTLGLGYFLGEAQVLAKHKKKKEKQERLVMARKAAESLSAIGIPVNPAFITPAMHYGQIVGIVRHTEGMLRPIPYVRPEN